MTTSTDLTQAFFDHLNQATHLVGSARADAYDRLAELAAPALQATAAATLDQVHTLLFERNYTDEGAYLYLTGYKTTDGAFHERHNCADMDTLDTIVFVITGSGEDGSGLTGMTPTGNDTYNFDINSTL